MLQQRQMAINIVSSPLDQRRSCMRIRLAVPAEVSCPGVILSITLRWSAISALRELSFIRISLPSPIPPSQSILYSP